MFVVSGYSDQYRKQATEQWDGSSWHASHVTPLVSLGGFLGSRVNAYFDRNRQSVVTFQDYGNAVGQVSEWDGSAWNCSPMPQGTVVPGRAAFDVLRQRAVMVRGSTTQEWDGVSWTTISTTPIHNVVWHQGRGRIVGSDFTALFEWNGLSWTQIAAVPSPGLGIVYDYARDEIVLYGGVVMSVWDGSVWTQHAMPGPPSRRDYGFAYDKNRQRVMLFGGRNVNSVPGVFLNDMWEWDGVSWAQVPLTTAPSPRDACQLVFDEAHQRMIVVGGMQQASSGGFLPIDDVWAFDTQSSALIVTLGAGCGGTIPELVASEPNPGVPSFTLEVHGAPAAMPCLIALTTTPGNVSLGGACSLFIPSQDHLRFVVTNAAGFAAAHAPIPFALQGYTFAAQAAVLDASSPIGVSLTQGLSIRVGG
jgi:hypothetical protein